MTRVTHQHGPRRTRDCAQRRSKAIAGLAAVALCLSVLSGCAGGSSAQGSSSAGQSEFAGTALTPVQSAPPLALRNYLGDPVNLHHYRGKAVLVTFLYTHCVDVCPVIAANLASPSTASERKHAPSRSSPSRSSREATTARPSPRSSEPTT